MIIRFVILLLTLTICSPSIFAKQTWNQFISSVKDQAHDQGIRPDVIEYAFSKVKRPSSRVLRLDRNQPEKRLTYLKYRRTRASQYKIMIGRKKYREYAYLLHEIGDHFNVDPCFITSLWGMETSYGSFKGSFPVIQSLATLAYDNRRGAFFRKELLVALHILNEGHVELPQFKGEWAGASGHTQFLPSSWKNFAIDYDEDGYKDIWNNLPDAFASIANYLKQSGWKADTPIVVPVKLPANFTKRLLTLRKIKTVRQWEKLGVRFKRANNISPSFTASIIHPHGGPVLMVFNNFRVLMRWNRSTYFAGTVTYLADNICKRKHY